MPFALRLSVLGVLLQCLAGCEPMVLDGHPSDPSSDARVDTPTARDAGGDSSTFVGLDPTTGRYRLTCDGSAAVALDFTHFVTFNDSDQVARVFRRGAMATAEQAIDLSSFFGIASDDEADLEDAARVDNRIYVLGSHARKSDGTFDPSRHQFAAFELTGVPPIVTLQPAGRSGQLLRDMLVATNWSVPDSTVITALTNASQLDRPRVDSLAPKNSGINLEGLARAPTFAVPQRMVIGLRNPQLGGRAIVVTLVNPHVVVAGGTARFGEAMLLDLGGLGIRGMTWSPTLQSVLILAGPHDGTNGPFRLYQWSGAASSPPVFASSIVAPVQGGQPDAIVAYPTTKDVEVLFDSDDVMIGGGLCEDVAETDREFRDLIVQLN